MLRVVKLVGTFSLPWAMYRQMKCFVERRGPIQWNLSFKTGKKVRYVSIIFYHLFVFPENNEFEWILTILYEKTQ